MREIILDTETTGLKPEDGERVIEIGAIELVNRYATGKTFHVYLNPEGRNVHPDAMRVHGISNEFLNDKPRFADIAEEFLAFIAGADLVAHNASFDMNFLNHELRRLGKPSIDRDLVVDTLVLARQKHPMGPNSLDALCSRYNIDNSSRTKHGALLDSELLAEVYIELLGGKQASLSLDTANDEIIAPDSDQQIARVERRLRDQPLAPRLSATEIEAHERFIASLGENAVWKKYLN